MFLFRDSSQLIQIATEHRGVWDVFGGFGELEKNDAGADGQETHDDGYDLTRCAFEATEKYGRGYDGGGCEGDVVGWGHEGGVEDVECFLQEVSTILSILLLSENIG